MAMDAHQQRALRHPCYFGFETMHPRFGWRKNDLTYCLTVNNGHE